MGMCGRMDGGLDERLNGGMDGGMDVPLDGEMDGKDGWEKIWV